MNFIKKAFFLSLALASISANITCMNSSHQSKTQPQTQSTPFMPKTTFKIGDYLTQLGSIYSIDTPSSNVVKGLAALRSLFSGAYVFRNTLNLLITNKTVTNLPNIVLDVVSTYMRTNNVITDYRIWKNATSVASVNSVKHYAKNLDNKKLCQYSWLTLNALFPYLMNRLRGGGYTYAYQMLAEISELYRQKLMYAMIVKKYKIA